MPFFRSIRKSSESNRIQPPARGPRGHRMIGSLLDVQRDRIRFVTNATHEFGDLVEFRMGPKKLFLLSHPDHARHVLTKNHANYRKGLGLAEAIPLFGNGLLTSEGRVWARDKTELQPAFKQDRFPEFGGHIVDATLNMLDRWTQYESASIRFDIDKEMARLTLRILCDALLCLEFQPDLDKLISHMDTVSRWSMSQMTAMIKLPRQIPTPKNRAVNKALQELDEFVQKVIQAYRPSGRQSILDLLLPSGSQNLKPQDHKRVRDHLLTFLMAGHETTAATLTWTWYLLSQNPNSETRLIDELNEKLGGNQPTHADVRELDFTRSVIQEVIRLYPPVWMISRKAIALDRIDNVTIPAGADVLISVYTLHRHPEFWSAPNCFKPDRFAAHSFARQSSLSYLPFGAGPRTCIGANLGLFESMLIVATVLQRFRIRVCDKKHVQPEAMLTLRPRGGLTGHVVKHPCVTSDENTSLLTSRRTSETERCQ